MRRRRGPSSLAVAERIVDSPLAVAVELILHCRPLRARHGSAQRQCFDVRLIEACEGDERPDCPILDQRTGSGSWSSGRKSGRS